MSAKSRNIFRNVLRILGTVAVLGCLMFFAGEGITFFKFNTESVTVSLLFALFLEGYYYLWENILVAGIIFIVWHIIQWGLVFTVWSDGDMTLILGFPIFLLGLAAFIYVILEKKEIADYQNRMKVINISL